MEYAWKYSIPAYAFATGLNQSYLEECILPDTLKTIENSAFKNASLVGITLPYGLTTLGPEAFAFSALHSITVPATVTDIGRQAFGGCSSLDTVTLYTTNTATKINEVEDSWFFLSSQSLVIYIPSTVIENPNFTYGPKWNYFNETTPLEYREIY